MDLNQPLFPAPEGYVVDLANPQRQGQVANYWVAGVGMVLATIFLGIRVYTKTVLSRSFSTDDISLVMAWVFSIAVQIVIIYQYAGATLGVHIWELSGHDINFSVNMITVASTLYCPLLACAKFSLLFFYLKLSPMKWFRMCVYASMFIVVGYNIGIVFPLIFACRPLKRNFDVTVTEGYCINRTPLYIATAVLNIVTDIMLLILPIPMIVRLQMPRVQKIGLILIFGVGSLTCITSCVRLVLLFPMLKSLDTTWVIVTPGIWILIEANLVIITGALPVMRLFFRHVAPSFIGESSFRSRSKKTEYAGGTHHSELQTISKKSTRKQYGRMDVDDDSLEGEEYGRVGWTNDGNSETHIVSHEPGKIVQTKTTVIKTEPRPANFNEDFKRTSF